MKTILLTGGSGFIFSRFCEIALERGYRVINVDKLTYASRKDFNPNNKNYTFIQADVKDLKQLPYCDYVVHAASESHVDASLKSSKPFVESNILGTYNLLELLKNKKIEHLETGFEFKYPKFILVSTDETFGEIDTGSFKEEDRRKPGNPYSATKASAEMLVHAWHKTYGIPMCITNCVNIYGPHQHPEKLIPHIITQLLKGEKIKVHGDGSYKRCWLYVDDKCDAIMKIMEQGRDGENYNIGSVEEYSVLEIVEKICKKFNKNILDCIEFVQNRSGQDIRYNLNDRKIKKELKWKQQYKMDDVLDKIIESYENEKFV